MDKHRGRAAAGQTKGGLTMHIYYEAKSLERAIDATPVLPQTAKNLLKKIIRSAPVADEVEKLRRERDAAVATLEEAMSPGAFDGCSICKYNSFDGTREPCSSCSCGSNWEWRGVVDE